MRDVPYGEITVLESTARVSNTTSHCRFVEMGSRNNGMSNWDAGHYSTLNRSLAFHTRVNYFYSSLGIVGRWLWKECNIIIIMCTLSAVVIDVLMSILRTKVNRIPTSLPRCTFDFVSVCLW